MIKKVVGLIFLGLLMFYLIRADIFSVNNVSFQLDKIDCTTQANLQAESELLKQNILFINDNQLAQKIQSSHVCVKSVLVEKKFPNSLIVKLSGRTPFAIVKSISDNQSKDLLDSLIIATGSAVVSSSSGQLAVNINTPGLLIDDNGVLYAKQTDQVKLPLIYFSGSLSIGDQNKVWEFKQIVDVINKLKTFNLNSNQVVVTANSYAYFDTFPRVVFNLNQSLNNQLASLQLILQMAKIKNENIEVADLRFDKPVIRFAPKK